MVSRLGFYLFSTAISFLDESSVTDFVVKSSELQNDLQLLLKAFFTFLSY